MNHTPRVLWVLLVKNSNDGDYDAVFCSQYLPVVAEREAITKRDNPNYECLIKQYIQY